MKKLFSAALVFSFLTLALPAKKAEAGFIVTASLQEFVWKHKYQTLDTVLVIALPVTMITVGIFAVGIATNPFNSFTLIAGAVCLDQKLEGSEITAALQKRYPFINNTEVLNQLADKIINRYPSEKDQNGNAMIGFSKAELASISEQLDLSPAEIRDLVTLE